MKNSLTRALVVVAISAAVTGCVQNWSGTESRTAMMTDDNLSMNSTVIASGQPLGGHLEQYMNQDDKIKMGRGLDGAVGKTTTWTNPANGAQFAVTPIRKVDMSGARFCRAYSVTMSKQGSRNQVNGTACIGQDGIWHVIG